MSNDFVISENAHQPYILHIEVFIKITGIRLLVAPQPRIVSEIKRFLSALLECENV